MNLRLILEALELGLYHAQMRLAALQEAYAGYPDRYAIEARDVEKLKLAIEHLAAHHD